MMASTRQVALGAGECKPNLDHWGPELMAAGTRLSSPWLQVIFPIGVPDEGTFDWLDDFLKKNPRQCNVGPKKIYEKLGLNGLERL